MVVGDLEPLAKRSPPVVQCHSSFQHPCCMNPRVGPGLQVLKEKPGRGPDDWKLTDEDRPGHQGPVPVEPGRRQGTGIHRLK